MKGIVVREVKKEKNSCGSIEVLASHIDQLPSADEDIVACNMNIVQGLEEFRDNENISEILLEHLPSSQKRAIEHIVKLKCLDMGYENVTTLNNKSCDILRIWKMTSVEYTAWKTTLEEMNNKPEGSIQEEEGKSKYVSANPHRFSY